VILINGRGLQFHTPLELKNRQEIAEERKAIEAERVNLKSKPDPGKEADLKTREEAFRKKTVEQKRTLDGIPYSEKIFEVVKRTIETLPTQKGDWKPADRVALREEAVKQLEAIGIKVDSENEPALEAMISVTLMGRQVENIKSELKILSQEPQEASGSKIDEMRKKLAQIHRDFGQDPQNRR